MNSNQNVKTSPTKETCIRLRWGAHIYGALLAIGTVSLTGCTSHVIKPINAFASATADLTSQVTQTYKAIEETTIDRQVLQVAQLPPGEVEPETIHGINGLFEEHQLKSRLLALAALEGYANALQDLSGADFSTDIGEASKELYGSLSSLPIPVAGGVLKATVSAINGIGRFRAESKRREAIRTIITESNDHIQEICKDLIDDISDLQSFTEINLKTLLTDSLKAYQDEAQHLRFDAKAGRIRAARNMHLAAVETDQAFKDTTDAVNKLADAHKRLAHDLSKRKRFKDIDIAAEVGELIRLGRSLKAFHSSLSEIP